jgi:hypothetical protein
MRPVLLRMPFDQRPTNVRLWHIATFRCAAEFDRYRGMADIEQAAPIKRNSRGHALDYQGYSRNRQKVAPRTGD